MFSMQILTLKLLKRCTRQDSLTTGKLIAANRRRSEAPRLLKVFAAYGKSVICITFEHFSKHQKQTERVRRTAP